MWKKIWLRITTTVTGGAIIIATASVASRLLGLIRDRMLASMYGAGETLDAYYAAFKLPDLIFNILVLGALSSAFIPVFVRYLVKNGSVSPDSETWRLANSLLNILLIGLVTVGGIFFIFAEQLIPVIAPGFDGSRMDLTIQLTRIMLVAIVFFGVSNIATGILTSFKRYVSFAFAPVMYNLGIIFGIVVLSGRYGILGVAYGVVIGAVIHMAVQVPSIFRLGYRYRPLLDFKHEGVRQVGKLMVPRAFGLAVAQVDQLISVIIGSTLAVGTVAVFNFANNLQSFPIGVFGYSLAIAAFPIFSEAFAQNDTKKFVEHFSIAFRRVLFLIIPVSVLMLLLRAQIVRLVLGSGNFGWADTILTAQTLGYFSLSLFAQALIPMLARSFYALQDTKTPVKVGLLSVGINVILGWTLSRIWGVIGLGLAFSVASIVNMLFLLILLHHRVGNLDDNRIANSTLKILFISSVMGLVSWGMLRFLAIGVDMQRFVGVLIQGVGAGAVGIIVYLALAVIMKCEEIHILTSWVKKTKAQLFFRGGSQEEQKP
ncbi:MAG: murein biosynthesis integral membrane protein MurJ [Candidatus Kerfeldbacteria bacterium RIFCSPLOWO2_01_FULL_48_11]|uniref:Probable lipid II flippase MurJ n=1 Tax=Candidatus Kerfeldbacteria bacterium RIFCSPLOWO2_01_FULL_48_11 TaxID=1798543 RepID=A0A1G2B7R8_9BACT|nr:MAG: putative peptidoglycan lipid II flippase MurJ [Parcubacteria group bacterium GW2011_GWA2_48_9]OGY85035.1 MAG: murein biosynthesis integral membrane protein MurJ [Candidatus Kerfeldbacteria bacterium RIFCSPLOWO2_01_FULL_48_11]HCM68255.1 murein biosynthesis integral membrane protein MurJ [Candidatus Kerfeldbacteria bacterium]